MTFDQGLLLLLPLALDTPVSNCKAAVLVLVRSGYFISPVPAISGEHSPTATGGGARWRTSKILTGMGEKGLMEEDWNDRGNWRKKII